MAVYLRQYSVLFTFVSTLFTFASTVFFFVSTVFFFVSTVFFFKSYVTIAPPHPPASIHVYLHYSGRGRGTSPLPLNTCLHNIATRRPPHPSNTQQHTTTHKNTQQQTTTHNNSTQQYTTALGYIKLPMSRSFLNSGTLIVIRCHKENRRLLPILPS